MRAWAEPAPDEGAEDRIRSKCKVEKEALADLRERKHEREQAGG